MGFIFGLTFISQTGYSTTMKNIEEFATLKALGATTAEILQEHELFRRAVAPAIRSLMSGQMRLSRTFGRRGATR
jgi:hypothetical protein